MIIDERIKDAILDSLKTPLVFCDVEHIVRYINRTAIERYKEGTSIIGRSILSCHNPESQRMILEILDEMKNGLEERLTTDNEKHRLYMRAVRDADGRLVGYYERHEPPQKQNR